MGWFRKTVPQRKWTDTSIALARELQTQQGELPRDSVFIPKPLDPPVLWSALAHGHWATDVSRLGA